MARKLELNNKMLNRERIGSILKAFRETNEMNQRDVARAVGYLNVNFISMIETGRSAPPLGKLVDFVRTIKADYALVPIILKYLYPEIWSALSGALTECKAIFNCQDIDAIDDKLEEKFIELIKDYSSI